MEMALDRDRRKNQNIGGGMDIASPKKTKNRRRVASFVLIALHFSPLSGILFTRRARESNVIHYEAKIQWEVRTWANLIHECGKGIYFLITSFQCADL